MIPAPTKYYRVGEGSSVYRTIRDTSHRYVTIGGSSQRRDNNTTETITVVLTIEGTGVISIINTRQYESEKT